MAKIEAWLSCDLKKPVQVQGLSGNVFSMDNNGSRINVRIYDNGEKTTVSGSVTANCILADGSTINVNGSLTTANGQSVAYVDIPQSCLLVPGPIRIAIKLTASGVITTLAAVVTTVYRTQTDIVITPSAQIINDWNAEISAAIATQNAAIANQDTKINDLKSALSADMFAERYVEYNSLTPYSFVANANRPAFTRYGNVFTFNGSFGTSDHYFIKLSEEGTTNYTTSANSARAWPKPVQFKSGHTYRAKLELLSGTYTGDEGSYITVMIYKSDDTENYVGTELIFTPGEVTASVVFRTVKNESFTNAVFSFTIEDITESSLTTDAKTVIEAINELDGLIAKCLTGDYEEATVIPDNSDLNDYTTAGNYRTTGSTDLTTISNLPNGRGGRLFVLHPYNQRLLQLFFDPAEQAIWVRRYTTAWSSWAHVITSDQFDGSINELDELIAKCLTGDYEEATAIPIYSDFDDYTTDGNYSVRSVDTASNIDHIPVQSPGRLFVMHPYSDSRILQYYIAGQGYPGIIYYRYFVNTWSDWEYIVTSATLANSVQSGNNSAVTSDAVHNALKQLQLQDSTMGLAYSWWCNNRATDSYGNLYFGYISKDAKCGVGCRYPDGTVVRKDIFTSENCDDHNAPSVIILVDNGQEYVCVIGSTGHNADSKINVYVANEPNTILCDFTNRTHTITSPQGYRIRCSYSQAYFDTAESKIYNFFRIKQIDNTDKTFRMIWMCAISSDYGVTWSIYRAFSTDSNNELFYMWSAETPANTWTKRVVLQTNTTNTPVRPIRAGYINPKTLNILNANGTSINKPMTLMEDGDLAYDPNVTIADYDDFTQIIPTDENHKYRILDVWNRELTLTFLYVKSLESPNPEAEEDHHDITDWILYRYKDGTITEIAHLGLPFFIGSCYVTGANFIGDTNHIIYSKNDSATQDGKHSLHYVTMDGNTIVSDEIIKWSSDTIARPMRYDDGCLMYLKGKYLERQGTKYLTWHFGIGFIDHF